MRPIRSAGPRGSGEIRNGCDKANEGKRVMLEGYLDFPSMALTMRPPR